MKLSYSAALFMLVSLLSTTTLADPISRFQEGFVGPEEGVFTAEMINDADYFHHEMPVSLTGHIVSSLGGDLYRFKDETGNVIVEVTGDKWFGLLIDDKTKVTLLGIINYAYHNKYVEVKSVRVSSF